MAHDMKTPLMAIGGFVQQVQRKMADDKLTRKLDFAVEQVRRLKVTISTELQEGMPAVAYDAHRLQQALLNLVNNALEASPQGGEVVLRSQVNGACITIEIIDQGDGIPKERHDDIFTPFVTTQKKDTGLGLPIVKKVIEAHAGSIKVSENSEKGGHLSYHYPLDLP